jgi:hypothetical protein
METHGSWQTNTANWVLAWARGRNNQKRPATNGEGLSGLGPRPDYLGPSLGVSDDIEAAGRERYSEAAEARLRGALARIPPDCGYDEWVTIGMALRELGWAVCVETGGITEDRGFEIFNDFSSGALQGKEAKKYPGREALERKWASFGGHYRGRKVTVGTIFHRAREYGWNGEFGISAKYAGRIHEEVQRAYNKVKQQGQTGASVSLNDFHAYMPTHSYMFTPSRELWPASSVDARIPPVPIYDAQGRPVLDAKRKQKRIPASTWLDQNQSVEQMTWAPGHPMLIRGRLVSEGGWIERNGVSCFNLYRPPMIEPGDATQAGRWLDHVRKVYGEYSDHIISWLAHRVQHPEIKINHALVLGGAPGIGKDTLLEPVKYAVGHWNFIEVSPQQVLGRFNGFLKSTILRVSEARDLGDSDRFKFYDHMKAYTAAPPDVLRVDEKNLREHSIFNCCGVVITTNYKADGIYLPTDDRRHHVAWSHLTKEDFDQDYWNRLWGWYECGGIWHVAAYLAGLDISSSDPKAPPPKTHAFWDIVDAHRAPEDAELADVLDKMGNPDATTLNAIDTAAISESNFDLCRWLSERKNRRIIPHRLEKCGYVQVRNEGSKDGLWKIDGKRQVIYAKSILSIRERQLAAQKLMEVSPSAAE